MDLGTQAPPSRAAPPSALEILDRRRCLELLSEARFGRLAGCEGITPLLMPVRLRPGGSTVEVETDACSGTPLPQEGERAALEVDLIDPAESWSVVVSGTLIPGCHGRVALDLTTSAVSGRRVVPGTVRQPAPGRPALPVPGVVPVAMALRLLGQQPVGYLAVVAGRSPHIFPVNFALDGDCVTFRTSTGTKLHALSRSLVAFQADRLGADGDGWSVVLEGVAHELTSASNHAVRARAATLVEPWAPGHRPYFIRVTPLRIRGFSHRWR